jgi:hypothetical protein
LKRAVQARYAGEKGSKYKLGRNRKEKRKETKGKGGKRKTK